MIITGLQPANQDHLGREIDSDPNVNRLTKIERKTNGSAVDLRVLDAYDANGSRVISSVDVDGDGINNATVTKYMLDGWNPAVLPSPSGRGVGGEGLVEVYSDLGDDGSLKTRYLRGDKVDQLLARVEHTGDHAGTYWYLTDTLGSIRKVIDSGASIKDAITYDAYGNIASETDSSYRGRYAWTGREIEVEAKLQFNRARYYDPSIGRWIAKDPIGFDAGDSNLYRYVNNAPTNYGDPSGLDLLDWIPGGFILKGLADQVNFALGAGGAGGKSPELTPLNGPANLTLTVDGPPHFVKDELRNLLTGRDDIVAKMSVTWHPQNVKKGGFIVQYATALMDYATEDKGARTKEYYPHWEAWEVDKTGKVYDGYIAPRKKIIGDIVNGFKEIEIESTTLGKDIFNVPIPKGPKGQSSGILIVLGYARYSEKCTVNWPAENPDLKGRAGVLPATLDRPEGWGNDFAIRHGFRVEWDDFKKQAPRFTDVWEK